MTAQQLPEPVVNVDALAVYCRTDDHDRCSMVCACACHEMPRGTSWAELSATERGLVLVES